MWGATKLLLVDRTWTRCFNSRTPCGVRQAFWDNLPNYMTFQFTHPVWGATGEVELLDEMLSVSIHAPRVGCDVKRMLVSLIYLSFQFTHPVWGATIRWFWDHLIAGVSIHAPRVGCDSVKILKDISRVGFNSRTPCGVRQPRSPSRASYGCFNSRTPCGVRP